MLATSFPPMLPLFGATPPSPMDTPDPVLDEIQKGLVEKLQSITLPLVGPVFSQPDATAYAEKSMAMLRKFPTSPAVQKTIDAGIKSAYTDVAKREAELARAYTNQAARVAMAAALGTIGVTALVALIVKG